MAWTLQQSTSQEFGQGSSPRSQTFASNVSAGDLLLCWVAMSGTSATATVSDSQGNTWTQVGSYVRAGTGASQCSLALFMALAGSTSANTVTVTQSASVGVTLAIDEWQPPSGTPAADANIGASAGAAPSYSTGACTVSGAGELVVAAFTNRTGQTGVTVASPFTVDQNQLAASVVSLTTAYDANAGTSEGCTFTPSTSPIAAALLVASFSAGATAYDPGTGFPWPVDTYRQRPQAVPVGY